MQATQSFKNTRRLPASRGLTAAFICLAVSTLVPRAGGAEPASAATPAAGKPNIVWIIGDDHGWRYSEPYGDKTVKTPQMNRLASEGMRFTHAFAASALCSPSRSVMTTGLYPHRNGAHVFSTFLSDNARTMPEYFREMGYHVVLAGKYDVASRRPNSDFDEKMGQPVEKTAAGFLEKYDWKKPLMLQVGSLAPHVPWPKESRYQPQDVVLPPRFVDTPETRLDLTRYYEEVSKLDFQIGQVLDAIQRAGQEQTTLVIYTSDQGAQLPFAKWCLYDEGLRTPLLARWPGRIKPGTVTDAMVSLVDLLPTCLEAAGAVPPGEIDGRSFLGVLTGKTDKHSEIIYGAHSGQVGSPHKWWTPEQAANHYPIRSVRTKDYHYLLNLAPNRLFNCHISGVPPESPVGVACWRSWVELAKSNAAAQTIVQGYLHRPLEELYDLNQDPGETRNLAGDPGHGETLSRLRVALHQWRRQQGDCVPIVWEPEPADRAGQVEQWKTQVQEEK